MECAIEGAGEKRGSGLILVYHGRALKFRGVKGARVTGDYTEGDIAHRQRERFGGTAGYRVDHEQSPECIRRLLFDARRRAIRRSMGSEEGFSGGRLISISVVFLNMEKHAAGLSGMQ
jgi:hypothetical protein